MHGRRGGSRGHDEEESDDIGDDGRPPLSRAVLSLAAGAALGGAVALVALVLSPRRPPTPPPASPAHIAPASTALPAARGPTSRPTLAGSLSVRAIELTCRTGTPPSRSVSAGPSSSAPTAPAREVCRVRLSVLNVGGAPRAWSLGGMRLRTAAGVAYAPDAALTSANGQPDHLTVAPGMRVDFDLYAAPPDGRPPVGLAATGSDGDALVAIPLPSASTST